MKQTMYRDHNNNHSYLCFRCNNLLKSWLFRYGYVEKRIHVWDCCIPYHIATSYHTFYWWYKQYLKENIIKELTWLCVIFRSSFFCEYLYENINKKNILWYENIYLEYENATKVEMHITSMSLRPLSFPL